MILSQKKEHLHPDNIVIRIASYMEPGAGIHKRRIPALEHIAGIV
jgi:hypothetical protein